MSPKVGAPCKASCSRPSSAPQSRHNGYHRRPWEPKAQHHRVCESKAPPGQRAPTGPKSAVIALTVATTNCSPPACVSRSPTCRIERHSRVRGITTPATAQISARARSLDVEIRALCNRARSPSSGLWSPISPAHRNLPASSEPSYSATLLGLPECRGTPHGRFDEATAALKVISDVMASRSATLRLPDRIAWTLQILPRADTPLVSEDVQQAIVGHIRMCRADPHSSRACAACSMPSARCSRDSLSFDRVHRPGGLPHDRRERTPGRRQGARRGAGISLAESALAAPRASFGGWEFSPFFQGNEANSCSNS